MKRNQLMYVVWLCVLPAVVLWGSGCGTQDGPPTYPVTGTVTMNGQPVVGANVNFQLSDGSRSAVGVTDSQGRYRLMTFAPDDGALPGQYQVAITKYEQSFHGNDVPDDDHPDYDPDAPEVVPQNVLPTEYANPESSGFTATVTEGTNEFDFQIQ